MTELTVDCCVSNIELAKANISTWIRSTMQYYRSNHGTVPVRIQDVNETATVLMSRIRKASTYTDTFLIEEIAEYIDRINKTKDTNYLVIYKEYRYALQMELQRRALMEVAA